MAKRTFLSPIHKATRQIGLYFEEKAGSSGLTPQEGHLLTYLRSYAPAPVGELVRVFGVKASTMTGTLDRLESLGLVERRANPDDRRSFFVVLTPSGRPKADAIRRFVEETESDLSRRVTEKEYEGFLAVLKAVEEMSEVVVRPPREVKPPVSQPPRRPRRTVAAPRPEPALIEERYEPPEPDERVDDMEFD